MIDSHFHIWRLSRGDYGWLTPSLAPIYRDVSVADWRVEAESVGVKRGILVQAAPTEAETLFLLEAAARNSELIAGVVGWTDLAADDAEQRIARLAANARLVGLRPMLHDLPDADWIVMPQLAPALAAIARADLTFDALVRPVHLPHLLTLARRHPRLRIVVDHGAKPDIRNDAFAAWAGEMTRIARETTAFCKISGLLTEAHAGAMAADLRPYVDHLLTEFGAARLLWGSDWPVLELASDYATWFDMSRELIPQTDRDQVFEHSAVAAYPRARKSP